VPMARHLPLPAQKTPTRLWRQTLGRARSLARSFAIPSRAPSPASPIPPPRTVGLPGSAPVAAAILTTPLRCHLQARSPTRPPAQSAPPQPVRSRIQQLSPRPLACLIQIPPTTAPPTPTHCKIAVTTSATPNTFASWLQHLVRH